MFFITLLKEHHLLSLINSPFVISSFGTFQEANSYTIILEHCDTDLGQWISSRPYIPLPELLTIFSQLSLALVDVHNLGILHRDIKCSNIFIHHPLQCKLGDFGISKLTDSSSTFVGTLNYMSPEVLQGQSYSNHADVYSLGVVLYKLIHNSLPVVSRSPLEIVSKIKNREYCRTCKYDVLHQIVNLCLSCNPSERPSAETLVSLVRRARLLYQDEIDNVIEECSVEESIGDEIEDRFDLQDESE
ncbi:hypothetical protein GEMRC1_009118 [Eukaryota sp. GEM-RC1]